MGIFPHLLPLRYFPVLGAKPSISLSSTKINEMKQRVESSNFVQGFDGAPSRGVLFHGEPQVNITDSAVDVENPKKFTGIFFKRWQRKMLFFLISIGLAKWLIEEPPEVGLDENAEEAWQHNDYICRNHILNCLHVSIFGMYYMYRTAKTLWLALDNIWRKEDVGTTELVVGKLFDFRISDCKAMISQVEELRSLISEVDEEGLTFTESSQVTVVIEKLPPSWRVFSSYLRNNRKGLKMEDLIVLLCKEE